MEQPTSGQCIVAFGYDVDMPGAGLDYLYDRSVGWPERCHGRLNEDVANYVRQLAEIAEQHDARLQFFLQGNTPDHHPDLWVDLVKRGHAADGHSYHHIDITRASLDEVREQVGKTKRVIDEKLGTVSLGMRGPGGYADALDGREDVQQVLLTCGMRWITCKYAYQPIVPEVRKPSTEDGTIQDLSDLQPYHYPTGLVEIPFCLYQDRSYFDTDLGGDPTAPISRWAAYLKRAVDFVSERGLILSLTVHPSTSFKHDPEARYLDEVLAHCRNSPRVQVGTYRDIYAYVSQAQ